MLKKPHALRRPRQQLRHLHLCFSFRPKGRWPIGYITPLEIVLAIELVVIVNRNAQILMLDFKMCQL